jgi:hypothetical protein
VTASRIKIDRTQNRQTSAAKRCRVNEDELIWATSITNIRPTYYAPR